MKNIRRILLGLLGVTIVISLLSTYYEKDVARRTYEFSKEELFSGDYKTRYKSIEDEITISLNTYRYNYETMKQKFVLDIVALMTVTLLVLFELKKKT